MCLTQCPPRGPSLLPAPELPPSWLPAAPWTLLATRPVDPELPPGCQPRMELGVRGVSPRLKEKNEESAIGSSMEAAKRTIRLITA